MRQICVYDDYMCRYIYVHIASMHIYIHGKDKDPPFFSFFMPSTLGIFREGVMDKNIEN